MQKRDLLLVLSIGSFLFGCGDSTPAATGSPSGTSTSATTGAGGAGGDSSGSSTGGAGGMGTGGSGGTADACGAIPKSKCKPANEGSVIRGIAHFDPSHFAAGAKPKLVMFLNHQVTYSPDEATTGGHPHAYKVINTVDVASGQVAFSIDDCEFGTSMYSEDDCGYNLVLMLDENGNNDPFIFGQSALTAEKGELVGMAPVEISCHASSPCLDVTLDCTDGTGCTTYKGIDVSECKCAPDTCHSTSKICTP